MVIRFFFSLGHEDRFFPVPDSLSGRVVRVENDLFLRRLVADVLREEAFALGIHLAFEVKVVDVAEEGVHLLGQAGNIFVLILLKI